MTNQTKQTKYPWKLIISVAVLLIALCILCLPLIQKISTPQFHAWLTRKVEALGLWGMVALLLLQVLQIVVAFLPGEPVELMAGAMYGAVGGLLICLIGILIGSCAVFILVRRRGRAALEKAGYGAALDKYVFLQNEQKLETAVFLLYLLPGTPKDILIYVCALTNLSCKRFLFLSTIARIPSVVTSTLAGSTLASGNLSLSVGIFCATGLAGLLGIWLHGRILQHKNKKKLLTTEKSE